MTETPDWLSPDAEESVVWSGHPRVQAALGALVVGAALFVAVAAPAVVADGIPTVAGVLAGAALLGLSVAGGVVYVRSIEYAVTTENIYAKRGLLSRRVSRVALENVQDTTIRQSALGTRFDHGTVSFSTAGSAEGGVRFYAIDRPFEVKRRIDERRSVGRRAADADDWAADRDAATDDPFGELLAELRRTRRVAERIDGHLEEREAKR